MILETWKDGRKVEVARDAKGRFVSWHKAVEPMLPRGKTISIYGYAEANGLRSSRRYQIHSRNGKNLMHATMIAVKNPPRRQFLIIDAEAFLFNPFSYIDLEARWVGHPEVAS